MKRPLFKIGVVAGVFTLAGLAAGPAFATHNGTGEADSSASTGTGSLFNLLDTGACTATDTSTSTSGAPTGRCGDGLSLNAQINAFSQNASAPGDGTSAADASVAPIDIKNFASLDLTGILDGLQAIDTGTVLDDVINGVDPLLQPALAALEPSVIAPIDDALQSALAQVGQQLPVTAQIGAVEAHCTATASPLSAEGNGTVAGINLKVSLGGQDIIVPIQAGTAPNTNLLVGAPQDLVNAVIDGLKASFTQSLGGALDPLNAVLSTIQTQVTDAIFAQIEPQLLQPLADALKPLISGTVNKQEPVSPSSTGEIQITALDLHLLDAASSNVLQLARTHCGPNTAGTPHGTPTPPNTPNPPGNPGPTPAVPTAVNSGMASNTAPVNTLLGAGLAVLTMAGAGGIAYRRLRMTQG